MFFFMILREIPILIFSITHKESFVEMDGYCLPNESNHRYLLHIYVISIDRLFGAFYIRLQCYSDDVSIPVIMSS